METYLSKDPLVLRIVRKGPFLDKNSKPKDTDDLTSNKLIKLGYNGKAKNSLINVLDEVKHDKVFSLKSVKKMWDVFINISSRVLNMQRNQHKSFNYSNIHLLN